jgi:biopolymer transport protein ExbD
VSETPKNASAHEKKSFEWFATLDRDGLRTRYRPQSRIYSLFFAVVPWLDIIVLTLAVVLFTHARAIVPGIIVDLPRLPTEEGGRSTLAIVVRAIAPAADKTENEYPADDGATVKPIGVMVFFDDERFNLSQPHHIATFRNGVRTMLARTGETQALLYLDQAVTYENSMRLTLLLRDAGVDRVNFVIQEP